MEHKKNIGLVLEVLRKAQLYCLLKKSNLFAMEINFLGHHILERGIEDDSDKVSCILKWPVLKSAKQMWQFLGIVRYITVFLPQLAEHMTVLTLLTRKECNTSFPLWTTEHQYAFDAIKALVVSWDCLTTINHEDPGDNKIFVTCNASKRQTGAMLFFGSTWESACLVTFDSHALSGAELNYPVHEQEMLAIMHALKKWQVDLLGSHVEIFTDHRTLENFDHQRDLSKRQAHWMEYLSHYEYMITYLPGDINTVADTLSRLPDDGEECKERINSVFMIEGDVDLLRRIRRDYREDSWCKGILDDMGHGILDKNLGISLKNGLLFIGSWLVIPKYKAIQEELFCLAHNNLGHFRGCKSYLSLRNEFYWPHMRWDLLNRYIPACVDCQQNKLGMSLPLGPLHLLLVPDKRFDSIAIDFVGPLPKDDGFNGIVTMTDRLGADIQIVACNMDMTAEEFVVVFFDRWYCENGCPTEIVSDCNKIFMSKFWKALAKISGIKLKMSMAYHPKTDGSLECSNKMVV
jgi:hypothetical protein